MYFNKIIGFLLILTSCISILGYAIDAVDINICYMMFSLLMIFAVLYNCYRAINGERSLVTYAAFTFLFFFLVLLEPFLNILSGSEIPTVDDFGTPDIIYKYHACSMLSFFIGSVLLFSPINESNCKKVCCLMSDYDNGRLFLIIILFFVFGLIPYASNGGNIISLLLMGRAYNGFSQFEVSGLANENYIVHLINLLTASGILSGFLLINKSELKGKSRSLIILIFLMSLLLTVLAGGRTRFGLIVMPLICYSICEMDDKFNVIKMLKYLGLSAVLVLIISIMVSNRNSGFDNIEKVSIDISGANMNREVIFISEHFQTPIACSNVIECLGLPLIDTINKFITNPIPRSIFDGKYLDPSFSALNVARTGFTGFDSSSNVTPTPVARYYMLYGLSGVLFITILFSLSLNYLSKKITASIGKMNSLIFCCFLFYFVQSIRDLNPGWLYTYLGVLLAYFVSKKKVY